MTQTLSGQCYFKYHFNGKITPPTLIQFNINSLCLDYFGNLSAQFNDIIFVMLTYTCNDITTLTLFDDVFK